MKKQTGITLIELIIAVAILGIMASIAVPNFSGLMQNSQLTGTYNSFAAIIATARAEAVNLRTPITLCPSSNGTSCAGGDGTGWSQGYIAFADTNGNSAIDPDEILRYETVPNGLTIYSPNYKTSFTIVARGRLRYEGSFVFCKGDDVESAKALNLWVTGLGRLATDGIDSGQVVEYSNGDNVTCGP